MAQTAGYSNETPTMAEIKHEARDAVASLVNYKPTMEEVRVLRECQSESFWYAALPASVALGATAGLMAKSGKLMKVPTGRLGIIPHVATGVIAGFLLGKMSYVKTCEDKLLKGVPDSVLAQAIRARREGRSIQMPVSHVDVLGVGPPPSNVFGWGGSTSDSSSAGSNTRRVAGGTNNSSQYQSPANDEFISNVDVDSEQASARNEVEDYHANTFDFDSKVKDKQGQIAGKLGGSDDLSRQSGPPGHSYDELRRYNRDAYYNKPQASDTSSNMSAAQRPPGDDRTPSSHAPSTFELLTESYEQPSRSARASDDVGQGTPARGGGFKRVNQYGDPIID